MKRAFTVVELMVVISVLAILFGIAVVSYGQWQRGIAIKDVQQNLANVTQGMKDELNFNNVYPTTLPTSFSASKGVTVTRVSGSTTTYCVQAVSKTYSDVIYHVSQSITVPATGAC
jgi:prepilin-type N-terminal cleavage/methylation domain-containing protein